MFEHPSESFQHEDLPDPPPLSFRVAELLPGEEGDPVSCLLHVADLSNPPEYEALSYAWGDPSATSTVYCQGKRKEVTQSLHGGLTHVRFQDRSRFLFADAVW